MKQRTVDMPTVMIDRLVWEAERRGISVGELLRRLVDAGLDHCGTPWPDGTPSLGHQIADAVALAGHRNTPLSSLPEVPPQTPPPQPLSSLPPIVPPVSGKGGDFERFWDSYPRRVGKAAAKRTWLRKAAEISAFGIEVLLGKLELLKASEQWGRDGGSYVPHPATWLNRGGWEDEPENGSVTRRDAWQRPVTGAQPPPPGGLLVAKTQAERWLWEALNAERITEADLHARRDSLELCLTAHDVAAVRRKWESGQ